MNTKYPFHRVKLPAFPKKNTSLSLNLNKTKTFVIAINDINWGRMIQLFLR